MRALVLGLAITNEAVVRQVQAHGGTVVVLDDRPTDASRERALALGVELQVTTEVDADVMVAAVDVVLPSPGVPIGHPIIAAADAAGVPVWSEFELAATWDDRPIVAVTGTNGKTTVTTLVTEMLEADGRTVVAAGNNDLPLVDALDRADVEVFVVEASSFRLQFTERFRPRRRLAQPLARPPRLAPGLRSLRRGQVPDLGGAGGRRRGRRQRRGSGRPRVVPAGARPRGDLRPRGGRLPPCRRRPAARRTGR